MSGGGALGSYEAGALWGMIKNAQDKTKYEYDVVTGVSAGAINSLAVSLFKPGDEENLVEFLSNRWATLDDGQVYKKWKLGFLEGLVDESGIFDDGPLAPTLDEIFTF
jgi:predicted acylesterase/phospholipase RssA